MTHIVIGLPTMLEGGIPMPLTITGLVGGILAILAGIIVIIWPRIIAYIIGIYLIIIGILAVISSVR
ncbi:MAG: hypothetical protein H6Q39_1365 [Chloroflexi bacterium]|jgi:uncharacterized membrane protein HdeD (DUF308 family)|nr:hypothetical protein [Chloroflexota bacterium]